MTFLEPPSGASPSLVIGQNRTGWMVFNDPGRSVNLLTRAVMEEFSQHLSRARDLAASGEVKVLVLWSGKEGRFIAGADVGDLEGLSEAQEGEAACRLGQSIFQELADLPIPTVAAVHGACVGGGLEMALACSHLVVSDAAETMLGFPEILLGLFPAWGGTTRILRRVGLRHATKAILTGRPISPDRAKALDLAHEVFPASAFRVQVAKYAEQLAGYGPPTRDNPWLGRRLVDSTVLGRWLILQKARKSVAKRTGGHYPAPEAALDVLERSCRLPLYESLELEARTAGPLIASPVSKNLIHIFHLRKKARKGRGIPKEYLALPRRPRIPPPPHSTAEDLVGGILKPYLKEARLLLAEGMPHRVIDLAAKDFGMAFGPVQLLRGRKSGPSSRGKGNREVRDRLVVPMILSALEALEEGRAMGAGAVDLAMVMGGGFPAFRGGLLRYADHLGLKALVQRSEDLSHRIGARFTPPPSLTAMADRKETFYSMYP